MAIFVSCPVGPADLTRIFKITAAPRQMKANGNFTRETAGAAAMTTPAAGQGAAAILDDIRAKVFNHLPTAAEVSPCPADATPVTVVGTTWCISNLAVPAYAGAGATSGTLYLVVWQLRITGATIDKTTVDFSASDTAGTTCRGCDAGSGGSGGMLVGPAPAGSVALSMAPLMWGLLVAGFGAGKGLLNGQWALDLKHVVGGYCVWDNGGDGVTTPLVELRCESPFAVTWKLTLTHGAVTEEYTRPATDWDPLTANVVLRAGKQPASGVAEQLTVVPG